MLSRPYFSLLLSICLLGFTSLAGAQAFDDIAADDPALAANCSTSYCGQATIHTWFVVDDRLAFGIHGDVPGSCSRHSREFRVELNTEGGRAIYAAFLSALNLGQKVNVWYDAIDPALQGTDQTNGCSGYHQLGLVTSFQTLQ